MVEVWVSRSRLNTGSPLPYVGLTVEVYCKVGEPQGKIFAPFWLCTSTVTVDPVPGPGTIVWFPALTGAPAQVKLAGL